MLQALFQYMYWRRFEKRGIVLKTFAYPIWLCLLVLLLFSVAMPNTLYAAELPDNPSFTLFTIGPDIPVSGGDWYSSRYGDSGSHYALINIPCSWSGDESLDIDLYSPEINYSTNTNDQTPDGINYDTTIFELYGPGTEVVLPDQPGDSDRNSIIQVVYNPEDKLESWVRLHSLPAPVACGQYVLRTATSDNDVNSWRLRVGFDNNNDPNDAMPTNYDRLEGSEDEIVLSTLTNLTAYVESSPDFNCVTNYQYVAPGLSQATFHNFDLNQRVGDLDATVDYTPPSELVNLFALQDEIPQEEGDPSASGLWNNSRDEERAGDIFENPESGWWLIQTCASSGNRYIQEGQQGVPIYWSLPPTPYVEITLDKSSLDSNGPTYSVGDTIEYVIRLTNNSQQVSPNPGRAYDVQFSQVLPANMNYLGCTIDSGLSGSCDLASDGTDGSQMTVNGSIDELGIGESGVVTVMAEILATTERNLISGVSLEYQDSLEHRFLGKPASTIIPLVAPTELMLVVSDEVDSAQPGDILTYAITVTNAGRLAARDVLITSTLPENVLFLDASNRGVEVDPDSGVITWPSVDVVGRTELRRTVTVQVLLPFPENDSAIEMVTEIEYTNPTDLTKKVNTATTDIDAILSSSIGGTLWRDVNSDGLLGEMEPGLSDLIVSVMIPTVPEPTFITTTTDARGQYHVAGLRAGEYVVTMDTSTLPPNFTLQGVNPKRVLVNVGEAVADINLGFSWPSSVSGMVWNEIDEDGIFGEREFVLEGVDVVLLDEDGNEVDRTQTSSDGAYLFSDLVGGTYTIQVDTTTYPVDLLATHDPDFVPDSATIVTLLGDGGLSQLNFGYISYGSIGGLVWDDQDGNGSQNNSEGPLPQVTAILLDRTGNEITRTVTSDNGRYLFEQLKLGDYQIVIDPASVPQDMVPAYEIDNVADGRVMVDMLENLAENPIENRHLEAVDFGFVMPTSIVNSRVWHDLNGNNLYDEGEPPLANVTLQLRHLGPDGLLDSADDTLSTTTTDIDGFYIFENLAAGTYQLVAIADTIPSGLLPGFDPDDIPDGVTEFNLVAGQQLENIDFAYVAVALSLAITDFDLTVTTADLLPYQIIYSNTSGLAAGQAILTNIVPENTIFTTMNSNPRWSCQDGTAAGTACTIDLGSVPATASGMITFSVIVSDRMPAHINTITNMVQIVDASLENVEAVETVATTSVDAAPDLDIHQTDGRIRKEPGEPLIYEITYRNEGNQDASGVEIVQRVPQFTTFNKTLSSPEWGCADNSQSLTLCAVDIGDLAAGATGVLTFATNIRETFPVNVANVNGLITIADDSGRNDEDIEQTPVDSSPDLEITLADDPGIVASGNTIIYTLDYANIGNQDAIGVLMVETVPLHTRYSQSNSTPGWDCPDQSEGGTNCILTIGSVPAGVEGQVKFAVQVVPRLPADVTEISHSVVIAGSGVEQNIINNVDDGVLQVQDPLVIELLDFVAAPDPTAGIRVQWRTSFESGTWGFLLYRSTDESWENAVRATPTLISGEGDERLGYTYTFIDLSALENVTYTYWLQELELSGATNVYRPIQSALEPAMFLSPSPSLMPIGDGPTQPSPIFRLFLPLVNR